MAVAAHTQPLELDPPAPEPARPLAAEIRGLDVAFVGGRRQAHALRGVDLDVGRGERIGLVGESGSGKSVLGLSLLGLAPQATIEGRLRLWGGDGSTIDMATATDDERRRFRRAHLGAVFQDPMTSLNPTMRVGRQVAEAAGSMEAAIGLLERAGVPEPQRRIRQYPHELSGGLRQRVMVAMAIAGDPSLVVADEPTTALDVTVQARIVRLLRDLSEDAGTALLFVTHDLAVAADVADRIVVLYAGRVCESGPVEQVLEAPQHPYTRALLASRLRLGTPKHRQLATLPGEPPNPAALPSGCAFAPRCRHAAPGCSEVLPEVRPAAEGTEVACVRVEAVRTEEAGTLVRTGEEWPPGSPPPRPWRPLEMVDVHKSFRLARRQRLVALDGVDLHVDAGEAVALVGESGSGKSTVLRVAAGLLRHDRGTVERSPTAKPQMVFQDAGASLTPWMTVGSLIRERCLVDGQSGAAARARAREVAALVGLPEEALAARAGQLSGGQRQRAAIARAVAVPPELLLCDEPTSALDVSLAATVLNLIGRLRRELGISVLFVTHDLAAARIVADRIAVMHAGRIVEEGDADLVTVAPTHPYTQTLLASMPGQRAEGR